MTTAREEYTATLLPNGQVLIAGGFNNNLDCLDTAEVYDPVANTFTALTATMTTPRCDSAAPLLPNGMVLITGGGYDNGGYDTAEIYDPMANTFTALSATMTSVRSAHTETLLPNGLVLLTGGVQGSGKGSSSDFNTAEVYDPVASTFTALTATMTTARFGHTATLLPNGQVLLTGGAHGTLSSAVILNTAEVYDPVANKFTALPTTMTTARQGCRRWCGGQCSGRGWRVGRQERIQLRSVGDLVVVIGVSGLARRDRRVAKGDVQRPERLRWRLIRGTKETRFPTSGGALGGLDRRGSDVRQRTAVSGTGRIHARGRNSIVFAQVLC